MFMFPPFPRHVGPRAQFVVAHNIWDGKKCMKTHMIHSNQLGSVVALTAAEDNRYRDYPAWAASFFPDCILAVAALSPDNNKLTDFSNFGQVVRIAAPVSEAVALVVAQLVSNALHVETYALCDWRHCAVAMRCSVVVANLTILQ
jgi:hypothetical protein